MIWLHAVLVPPQRGHSPFWNDTCKLAGQFSRGYLGSLGRAPEEACCTPMRLLTLSLVLLPPSQVHWGVRSLISLGLNPPLSTCLSGSVSLAGSSSLLIPPPPAKPLEPTSNCPEGNNGGAGLAGKEGGGENCSALRAPSPRPPSWGWGTHPELRSPAGEGRREGGDPNGYSLQTPAFLHKTNGLVSSPCRRG